MHNNLDKTQRYVLHFLTTHEAAILDAAVHVKFGELLKVEIESGEPEIERQVSSSEAAFIKALRDEGLTFMDTIIVHNGTPSQIEIDGEYGVLKIKYKRKIRFN